jgi:hypothetical protein
MIRLFVRLTVLVILLSIGGSAVMARLQQSQTVSQFP